MVVGALPVGSDDVCSLPPRPPETPAASATLAASATPATSETLTVSEDMWAGMVHDDNDGDVSMPVRGQRQFKGTPAVTRARARQKVSTSGGGWPFSPLQITSRELHRCDRS